MSKLNLKFKICGVCVWKIYENIMEYLFFVIVWIFYKFIRNVSGIYF